MSLFNSISAVDLTSIPFFLHYLYLRMEVLIAHLSAGNSVKLQNTDM